MKSIRMSKLRKALALTASDWLLIAQAWTWLGAVEAGLSCLPLQKLLRIIQRPRNAPTVSRELGELQLVIPERVAYCVGLATRLHWSDSTCLKRSLVLYALLARRGFDAQLLIGAARATKGQLDAHAWLECQGKVLLGETSPGRYTTLYAIAGSRPRVAQPDARATS
jgi:hypothetical protein